MSYLILLKEKFLSYTAAHDQQVMTMIVSSLLRSSYVVLYLQFHKSCLLDISYSISAFMSFIFKHRYHHMSLMPNHRRKKTFQTRKGKPLPLFTYQAIIVFQILPGIDTLKNTKPQMTWVLRWYAKTKHMPQKIKIKYRGVMGPGWLYLVLHLERRGV